jgi:hypothetical protein
VRRHAAPCWAAPRRALLGHATLGPAALPPHRAALGPAAPRHALLGRAAPGLSRRIHSTSTFGKRVPPGWTSRGALATTPPARGRFRPDSEWQTGRAAGGAATGDDGVADGLVTLAECRSPVNPAKTARVILVAIPQGPTQPRGRRGTAEGPPQSPTGTHPIGLQSINCGTRASAEAITRLTCAGSPQTRYWLPRATSR